MTPLPFSIYMAGMFTSAMMTNLTGWNKLTDGSERDVTTDVRQLLESYHYIGKDLWIKRIRDSGRKVFLDSGAFSAWTLGSHIDLNAYCDYIKEYDDIILRDDDDPSILMASVLDGIGDPQETYENQLKMEAQGVRPLPCFHFGEDERYLKWYVENYDYITIGGMVGKSTSQLENWLDRIWGNCLLNEDGTPKIKVHAFGITSTRIMGRYPWRSVDSSSWVQFAAFGNILLPNEGMVAISERSPSRHDAGRHLRTISPMEQALVLKQIKDRGFELERLETLMYSRAMFNVASFELMADGINAKRLSGEAAEKRPIKMELF